MLTGLLRGEPVHVLAPDVVSLTKRIHDAGYQTAAFTGHPVWLHEEYGFDPGFDHSETDWRVTGETIDSDLQFADPHRAERSFTFLQFLDTHSDGEGGRCAPGPQSGSRVDRTVRRSRPLGVYREERGGLRGRLRVARHAGFDRVTSIGWVRSGGFDR